MCRIVIHGKYAVMVNAVVPPPAIVRTRGRNVTPVVTVGDGRMIALQNRRAVMTNAVTVPVAAANAAKVHAVMRHAVKQVRFVSMANAWISARKILIAAISPKIAFIVITMDSVRINVLKRIVLTASVHALIITIALIVRNARMISVWRIAPAEKFAAAVMYVVPTAAVATAAMKNVVMGNAVPRIKPVIWENVLKSVPMTAIARYARDATGPPPHVKINVMAARIAAKVRMAAVPIAAMADAAGIPAARMANLV